MRVDDGKIPLHVCKSMYEAVCRCKLIDLFWWSFPFSCDVFLFGTQLVQDVYSGLPRLISQGGYKSFDYDVPGIPGGGITLEMALALCNRMNRGYKYFDKPPSTEAEGSISQVGGISCGTPLYLILCRSRVHT